MTPLHYTAKYNRASTAEILVARHASPQALDVEARSLIHYAARNNAVAALKYLLPIIPGFVNAPSAVRGRAPSLCVVHCRGAN